MNLRELEERVAAIEARPGVEYLGDLLLAYGLPRTRVPRLMSGTHDACRTLGVRHLRTRPYRPQTNGKAERFIRTMLGGWA